jgi:hypothetical protein
MGDKTVNNHLSIINHHLEMANSYQLLKTDNRQLTTVFLLRTTENWQLATGNRHLRYMQYERIHLFMQNKANFRKSQMDVNLFKIKRYAKRTLGGVGKTKPNKANSKPIKANLPDAQNERNCFLYKGI